ncbi:MAG: hypothetical protein KAI24_03835 [Planctomycetes bacterium]|nr:hypothetical protein [Planctomycetota bacterium]
MSNSTATTNRTSHAHADSSDLRDQVRVLGEDVKELGRLTKEALAHKVDSAKDAAQGAVEAGKDKALEYRDRLSEATREQPIKSVLIAAGIGAVIGLFMGRR